MKEQYASKADYYNKKFHGEKPDVIFVLGGGNKRVKDSRGKVLYKTSSYKGEYFPAQIGGAKARPIAALELSGYYYDAKIVTMSHTPNKLFHSDSEIIPSLAQVMAEELVRNGINKEKIIEKPEPTSTLTELMEVIKMSAENKWKSAAVVTNNYHIERAAILMSILTDDPRLKDLKYQLRKNFEDIGEIEIFSRKWEELQQSTDRFKVAGGRIDFIPAEDILQKRSPHYAVLLSRVGELSGYSRVFEQERTYTRKLKEGIYTFSRESFREYILLT
jgi:uncharacterized SAM-binding protein YcdF (DUF218 family)